MKHKDPIKYHSIDPPLSNTIRVPKNGWAAIRFKGTNMKHFLDKVFFAVNLKTTKDKNIL